MRGACLLGPCFLLRTVTAAAKSSPTPRLVPDAYPVFADSRFLFRFQRNEAGHWHLEVQQLQEDYGRRRLLP